MGNVENYNEKAGAEPTYVYPVDQLADDSSKAHNVDALFGDQGEGHTNYTTMSWKKACFVLLKSQVALGVLSMPTILLLVGGIPGTFIIFAMGLITSWSDWQIGRFKRNHPECYGIDDAGFVLAGRWGKEFFGALYSIFMIALVGASLIPISIALNVLSDHAICTVGWVAISAILCCGFASIQTLNKVSWVTTVGFTSIMAGIITISVAVGVQDRPASAPPAPAPWDKQISAYVKADFLSVVSACITAVFGLAGTPMFFPVISEMKRPQDFNKSLAVCQSIVVSTYITIAVVVWYYCGVYLSNPALGSAGDKMKKVTYGVALIGLFSSGILYLHYAAKMVFMRVLRNSVHLTKKTKIHYITWYGTVGGSVALGFLLAEAIPFFGGLVLLLGSLCGTILAIQGPAWMWLHDNWRNRRTDRSWTFWPFAVLAWVMIVFGSILTVAGVVAAVKSIMTSFQTGAISQPFSCADNS